MICHLPGSDCWPGFGSLARCAGLLAQAGQFLQGGKSPHHARHRIAVGDGDGLQAQLGGPRDQLLGMRGAGQEREIARHAELRIAGHANSPCANQLCAGQAGACGVW